MLQRVQLQNQDNSRYPHQSNQNSPFKRASQSPVQIAKSHGTLIWTTDYALKFLEKVLNDISHHHRNHQSRKTNHARVLKGNYIKIEVLKSKDYRPIYKEFKNWPKLHFNLSVTDSPFDSEASSKEMTRKNNRTKTTQQINRINNKVNTPIASTKKSSQDNPENQCGYCEICRDPYDVLKTHLKTQKHTTFVKNDANFIALDKLIKKTSNVAEFLSLRSTEDCVFGKRSLKRGRLLRECELKRERIESNYDSFETNKTDEEAESVRANGVHLKEEVEYEPRNSRCRNSRNSKQEKEKSVAITLQKSPRTIKKELEEEETRRSRRESCRRINYAEPKEDEENTLDSLISQIAEENVAIRKAAKEKPKVRGIRWRAPSPKDRPPSQKPEIYTIKDSPKSTNKSSVKTESTEKGVESIKMKLKRIRPSELSLLSNEADNFMFPKSAVSEPETDEDRQSTSDHAEESQEIISSDRVDDKAKLQQKTETSNKTRDARRKRRNNLDLFLTEHTDYYKFECPESRLRFQEAPTQPTVKLEEYGEYNYSALHDIFADETQSEDGVGGINYTWNSRVNVEEVEKFRYAFERVPFQEPWFLAFQRQDEGKEKIFEYYGSTAYRLVVYYFILSLYCLAWIIAQHTNIFKPLDCITQL